MRVKDLEERLAELEKGSMYRTIPVSEYREIIQELDMIYKNTGNKMAHLLYLVFDTQIRWKTKNNSNCLIDCMKILKCASELERPFFIVWVYNALGVFYQNNEDLLTAFDQYRNAMKCLQKNKDIIPNQVYQNTVRSLQNNMGGCLVYSGNHKEGSEYYRQMCEGINKTTNNCAEMKILDLYYVNTIQCYYSMFEIKLLVPFAREALAFADRQPKSDLYGAILLWNYVVEDKYGDKEIADRLLVELNQLENYEVCLFKLNILIGYLLESGKEALALHYIDIYVKLGEKGQNLTWLKGAYTQKKRYYERNKNSEEYKNACVQLVEIMFQIDAKNAKTKQESLQTYMQIVQRSEEQEQLKETYELLKYKSEYDELTSLPNRYKLVEFSQPAFEKAACEQLSLSVEIIDVDFFKQVNDNYGHPQGDYCLKSIADEIRKTVEEPELELCARYGGDEFVIVRIGKSDEEILSKMEQLKQAVHELAIPNNYSEAAGYVTISQGAVNKIPMPKDTLEGFLKKADDSLYEAKKISKNNIVLCQAGKYNE